MIYQHARLLFTSLLFSSLFLILSCENTATQQELNSLPQRRVTYISYTHTEGEAPEDTNQYKPGTFVVLRDQNTLKKDGFIFEGWSYTESGNLGISKPGNLIIMPDKDVSLFAIWKPSTFQVSYVAGDNGTIIGNSYQSCLQGESSDEVTAVPNNGYHFVCWSDGVLAPNRIDSNIQNDITVTAWFADIRYYTLSYITDGNGNIEGIPFQTINHNGDGFIVIANPKENFEFDRWSDGLVTAERIDTNITQSHIYTAFFKRSDLVKIVYNTDGNGIIQGNTEQNIQFNNSGSEVTALPNEGFIFKEWSDGLKNPTRIDANVQSNKTYTAIFERITYTVRFIALENGVIIGLPEQSIFWGDNTTVVTAEPNEGYVFVNWSDGNTNKSRQLFNIKDNVEISALFQPIDHQINYLTDGYGTIQGKAHQLVSHGKNGEIVEAIPKPGYIFSSWSDGKLERTRYETAVSASATFYAFFIPTTIIIQYIASEHGHIEGDALQTIEFGSSGTEVTAIPDPGYIFASWSDGYTLPNRSENDVLSNIQLTAYFTQTVLTISFDLPADDYGIIDYDYEWLDTIFQLNFTINNIYDEYRWYLNGIPQTNTSNYTLNYNALPLGSYTVTLVYMLNNKPFSKQYKFTKKY